MSGSKAAVKAAMADQHIQPRFAWARSERDHGIFDLLQNRDVDHHPQAALASSLDTSWLVVKRGAMKPQMIKAMPVTSMPPSTASLPEA